MRSLHFLSAFSKHAITGLCLSFFLILSVPLAHAIQEKKTENSAASESKTDQPPTKKTNERNASPEQDQKEAQKPALLDLKPKQPLLWKVTHKDSPKLEGYLFATTHSKNPSVLKMHPEVTKAMDKAEFMFMELIPQHAAQQHSTLLMPKHQRIEHRIGKELIEKLDKALAKIKPDLTRKKLQRYRIWAWALILPTLYRQEQNPGAKSQDDFLVEYSAKEQKSIGSLENPRMQLVPLNYLSKREQAAFLESTLTKFDDQEREDEFLKLYMEGQPEKLATFFEQDFEPDEFMNKMTQFKVKNYLVLVRNKLIGKKITTFLVNNTDKVKFFSTAAAHLVGRHSIPKLLAKAGYDVTLIRDGIPNIAVKPPEPNQPVK